MLYRFQSSPIIITKTLYKLLIRPILEYQLSMVNNTKLLKNTKCKLPRLKQPVFLKTKKSHICYMKKVHKELDLIPLNVRINKLTNMANNEIKDLYLPPKKLQKKHIL